MCYFIVTAPCAFELGVRVWARASARVRVLGFVDYDYALHSSSGFDGLGGASRPFGTKCDEGLFNFDAEALYSAFELFRVITVVAL